MVSKMRKILLRGRAKYLVAVVLVALIALGLSSLALAKPKPGESEEEYEERIKEEEYEEKIKNFCNCYDPNSLRIYVTEPELDLGNVTPLELIDKEGEESFQVWVLSGNPWIKKIEWSDLTGITGDDAEGKTISKESIKAYLKVATGNKNPMGNPPVTPPDGPPGQMNWMEIPNGWMIERPGSCELDREHFKVRFDPVWCNHAGSYSSTLTVTVTQL